MKKVMIFGTFDGLHPGHLDFFRQAKKFGEYLVVSVARDKVIPDFKGKPPMFSEGERFDLVSSCRLVDKAVFGDENRKDFYKKIVREKPDIVCLGYDQWAQEDDVRQNLTKIGLSKTKVVRLSPYKSDTHKSSKMKSGDWKKSL